MPSFRNNPEHKHVAPGTVPEEAFLAPDMQTTTATDPLVEKLAKQVTDLADGNGVTRDAIQVTGTRADRPMSLRLAVTLGWTDETVSMPGVVDVEASRLTKDKGDAQAYLREQCEALISAPGTCEKVADRIRSDPMAAFVGFEDVFPIGSGRACCHYVSVCERCGGHGAHECGNSRCGGSGTVSCSCGDGMARCTQCSSGSVSYQDSEYNHATRTMVSVTRQKTCGYCNGSQRTGTCYSCSGSTRVTCGTCGGSGRVRCQPCGATGVFTNLAAAWIIGNTARSASFPDGTPPRFSEQVREMPIRSIPKSHADTRVRSITAEKGKAVAVFDLSSLT